jgi:hypothetical protein
MKKVKVSWGMGRERDEDVLEFPDDVTDKEIEEEVKEYVMQYFEWYWEEVKK